MSRYFVVLISFIIFISPSTYASRLALVIGNGAYHHESSLANPVNDATDMAAVLKNLGFQVILKRNAKRRAMIRALQDFGKQLSRHDVGLFYYSGHGLQARGENFLVPVDAQIKSKADIEFESVPANRILRQMEKANNGVNIVILDACRSNPFTTNQKGFRKGLAEMNSPAGSLIAFATAPNTSAWGKSGERNSIYTKHFLKALKNQAHLSITDLFTQVRKDVIRETKGETKQVPWESVSLTERFCFRTCGETGTGILTETRIAKAEQARLAVERARQKREAAADEKRRQAPVDLISSYYADINRGDADSVIRKWKFPNRKKLRSLVTSGANCRVNNAELANFQSDYAKVSISVTCRRRWAGTIELENVHGNWKIVRIDLRIIAAEQTRREHEATKATDEKRRQAPVGLILSYYADINRGDVDSVISKWKFPNRKKLRSLVTSGAYCRVNNAELAKFQSDYAEVSISVTCRRRWVGTIELENVQGNWKIVRLNLR